MSTVNTPAEQRIVLNNVSWETYLALAAEDDRPGKRICYDQGVMEIMSPGKLHEDVGRLIGRFVEVYSEALRLPSASVKALTLRRDDMRQGLEADESFYIEHEPVVRGKAQIDLLIDPPPDLIVEIDITRSSINKFPLFETLKVPEVWIYDGEALVLYTLTNTGSYVVSEHSNVLQGFPIEIARALLEQRDETSQTDLICEFRTYIMKNKDQSEL